MDQPLYKVTDAADNLILIAPMETLEKLFDLHPDCIRRIRTEEKNNMPSSIFFNRSPKFGYKMVRIFRTYIQQ